MKRWETQEAQLRREWKRKYGQLGLHWDRVKDAYLFGWMASQRPEFAGYCWSEAESDLAEHWYNPQLAAEESAWDYVREAVAAGWERGRQKHRRAA